MRVLAIEDEGGHLLGYLGSRGDPVDVVETIAELLHQRSLRYRAPSPEELSEWHALTDGGLTIYGARYVPCMAQPGSREPLPPLH